MERKLVISFIQISKTIQTSEDIDNIISVPFNPWNSCNNVASKLKGHISDGLINSYFGTTDRESLFDIDIHNKWLSSNEENVTEFDDLRAWFFTSWGYIKGD